MKTKLSRYETDSRLEEPMAMLELFRKDSFTPGFERGAIKAVRELKRDGIKGHGQFQELIFLRWK